MQRKPRRTSLGYINCYAWAGLSLIISAFITFLGGRNFISIGHVFGIQIMLGSIILFFGAIFPIMTGYGRRYESILLPEGAKSPTGRNPILRIFFIKEEEEDV